MIYLATFSILLSELICEIHNIDQINSLRSETNFRKLELEGNSMWKVLRRAIRCSPVDSALFEICKDSVVPGCSTAELLDASHLIVESLTSIKG